MKPNFQITDSDGKKMLYVNGVNIWTLKKSECTRDVLEAIMHAYFIGVRDMRHALDSVYIPGDLQCELKKA